MSNKDFEERSELDEIEYLNQLVEERLAQIEKEQREREAKREMAQYEREAEMEFRRVQQEKRVNVILRMIATMGLHTVMVAALMIMVKTGVLAGWLGLGSAAGIAVCGGFHAGYCWREFRM